MVMDPDLTDVVREALGAAELVEAGAIQVTADEDVIVLRGTVPTFEESAAAAAIAGDHADEVRNELRVDHNAREGLGDVDQSTPGADAALQGSSGDPLEEPDDLVADTQASLDENVPWDPPHEEVHVPTRAESRGVADRAPGDDPEAVDVLDETADPAAKSLPDMTPEELERAANPEPRPEENAT